MTFAACFDIGTYAAVPKQVDWHFQNRAYEFVRLQRRRVDIEKFAHLRTEPNALRLPRENATTLGNQRFVVIVPGRPGFAEQAASFTKTSRHVW